MKAGAARVRITPDLTTPLPLLGWGDSKHLGKKASTEIYSRAVAFENQEGARLVFVCIEVCFVSESIRLGVLKRLRDREPDLAFEDHEIVLTATHTHNAPGGYCHSILYNIPSRGYHPEVYETYVNGVVDSILLAWKERVPANLVFGSGEIPLHEKVAFNRSVKAWNQNPEVPKFRFEEWDRALDRTMDVLGVLDAEGVPIALINWFAVHCTTMHRDFFAVHSDNKGIASLRLEAHFKSLDAETVVIFAQGAAGDVSPNFRKHWFKSEVRGEFRNDEKSCEFNAEIQSRYALKIYQDAKPIQCEPLESILRYHDCTSIPIPPEWVGGKEGVTTGPAALGCPFMAGTAEGGGAPRLLVFLLELVLKTVYWVKGRKIRTHAQGNKIICVELTAGKVFGDATPEDLPIPGLLDPLIRMIRFWSRIKLFKGEPMTPTVMPVQLFRVGPIGFVAAPGEFTTQAGVRIRNLLLPKLRAKNIERLVISGYANSYAGYITTEEEYQLQVYEGACTHFGRYTLLGYQRLFLELATKWVGETVKNPTRELPAPAMKSTAYLKKLSYRLALRRW
jgi:neutral ceramidase